jgi:hypothetical protein
MDYGFFIFFRQIVRGLRMTGGRIKSTRSFLIQETTNSHWRPSHAPRPETDPAPCDGDQPDLCFDGRFGPRAIQFLEERIGPNEQFRTRDIEPPIHVDFEKGRFHYHSEFR